MPKHDDALISVKEADEAITRRRSVSIDGVRALLMLLTGGLIVAALTLFIMTLLSLRGVRTGLSTFLPFLDQTQIQTLQTK